MIEAGKFKITCIPFSENLILLYLIIYKFNSRCVHKY